MTRTYKKEDLDAIIGTLTDTARELKKMTPGGLNRDPEKMELMAAGIMMAVATIERMLAIADAARERANEEKSGG